MTFSRSEWVSAALAVTCTSAVAVAAAKKSLLLAYRRRRLLSSNCVQHTLSPTLVCLLSVFAMCVSLWASKHRARTSAFTSLLLLWSLLFPLSDWLTHCGWLADWLTQLIDWTDYSLLYSSLQFTTSLLMQNRSGAKTSSEVCKC